MNYMITVQPVRSRLSGQRSSGEDEPRWFALACTPRRVYACSERRRLCLTVFCSCSDLCSRFPLALPYFSPSSTPRTTQTPTGLWSTGQLRGMNVRLDTLSWLPAPSRAANANLRRAASSRISCRRPPRQPLSSKPTLPSRRSSDSQRRRQQKRRRLASGQSRRSSLLNDGGSARSGSARSEKRPSGKRLRCQRPPTSGS